MNLEIANRLQKLRKEKGYSQEQLAIELGISRQAVSKWERAESSPDTDNLILLARLYNVSLDELLKTEDNTEEIIENNVDSGHVDDESEEVEEVKEKPTVLRKIQSVIPVITALTYVVLGAVFDLWHPGWIVFVFMPAVMSIIDCIIFKKLSAFVYPVFIAGVFLIMGFQFNLWHPGWVLFITIPVFYMIAGLIEKK